MVFRKIDENGFFLEDVFFEGEDIPKDLVLAPPVVGIRRAKWVSNKWVETAELDKKITRSSRLAYLEELMQKSYLYIKKIAMEKPYLDSEQATNEQYNSYNTMYNNAKNGLFDNPTNQIVIVAHEDAENRVAKINLILNNIRAKIEGLILQDNKEADTLLEMASKEIINIEEDFTISQAEIDRLKNKYGV